MPENIDRLRFANLLICLVERVNWKASRKIEKLTVYPASFWISLILSVASSLTYSHVHAKSITRLNFPARVPRIGETRIKEPLWGGSARGREKANVVHSASRFVLRGSTNFRFPRSIPRTIISVQILKQKKNAEEASKTLLG